MPGSADWWPAGLGRPGAVGAQNDRRYAVFPETRRRGDRTLSFTSQDGLVRVADLPRVAV
jgi:hypothetical protein